MGFTRMNDNVSVHQSMSDEPNIDDGLSAEELKKKFDEPSEKLKQAFNNLIDEMRMITGAQNIGANVLDIGDTSEANMQAKLSKIWEEMKSITLGQIPDNSIDKAKIKIEYENTLAKKEKLGPLYLASTYHEVDNENQKALDYVTPSLSSTNTKGYTITALTSNTTYNFSDGDIYTMLGGSGDKSIRGDYYSNSPHSRDGILIKFPFLLKATSIFVKGNNLSFNLSGSNDGINFTDIFASDKNAANGTYNFTNNNYYEYYKIIIANWNSGTGYLYNNVKFFGKYINKENAIITTPSLSSTATQDYTVTEIGSIYSYNGVNDIYTMLGGDGDSSITLNSGAGLLIEFPKYFKMTACRMCGSENLSIGIYGSNDGENFTKIHTSGALSGHIHSFRNISNTGYYKYYKIINEKSSKYSLYNDVYFKGEMLELLQGNKLSIAKKYSNEELEDYQRGMIVKIITPADYLEGENIISTLNIYETRDIEIPKDLLANKYYSLVYNGVKFVHESEVQNG